MSGTRFVEADKVPVFLRKVIVLLQSPRPSKAAVSQSRVDTGILRRIWGSLSLPDTLQLVAGSNRRDSLLCWPWSIVLLRLTTSTCVS